MSNILERFSEYDMTELTSELGGILFTPSVIISTLISSVSRSSLYAGAVLSIAGRSPDFLLNGYIIEVDRSIVKDNLLYAKVGGLVTPEKFAIIEGIINSLRLIKCSSCIENEAHKKSDEIALYDARRMEVALQNGITVLTSEPENFTQNPDELSHFFRHGFADVTIGSAIDVNSPQEIVPAKVWVFTPEALATLLNSYTPGSQLELVNTTELITLIDYTLSSDLSGSTASVSLSFNGQELSGQSSQPGPIDAVLRAIEGAIASLINLDGVRIHHRVSDTTTERDTVRVSVRLHLPPRFSDVMDLPFLHISAVDESMDTLLSTARAYVKALNTLLKEIEIRR